MQSQREKSREEATKARAPDRPHCVFRSKMCVVCMSEPASVSGCADLINDSSVTLPELLQRYGSEHTLTHALMRLDLCSTAMLQTRARHLGFYFSAVRHKLFGNDT